MKKSEDPKDRRRFQRVRMEPTNNMEVSVEGFGSTIVFDMSYEGAAFAQPTERPIEKVGDVITLQLKTDVDAADITAKVIRVNQQAVAVQFAYFGVLARIIVDRVVTDRIIGLNMNLIDPTHYSQQSDFNYWFHGPKETNLYLWWVGNRLHKAQLDMASASVVYQDDSFFFENKESRDSSWPKLNNQQISSKAAVILEQIETSLEAVKEFRKLIVDHASA